MASTAPVTQYRDEYISGYEDGKARLRTIGVTEFVRSGNTATFLVADSGSATAVTRGADGLIPARADNNTQTSATLNEWHDLVRKSSFNIFQSQGNQRLIMQRTSLKTLNRKIDDLIIVALDTATNDTGTTAIATLDMVMKSQAILGNAFVDVEDVDNIFGVITPAFHAYMMQVKEYASADYVENKPFNGPITTYRRWAGVNWIVHPRLSGVTTATEKCYMLHRDCLGVAVDVKDMDIDMDYHREQQYSWARASIFMGVKLLQQGGIVQMKHDGSAYLAA